MADDSHETIVEFFKIMSSADRLRILVALMERDQTAADLAAKLHMPTRDIIEHIAQLRWLKLVNARVEGGQSIYVYEKDALDTLNRTLLNRKQEPTPLDKLADEEMRKTLRPFFQGSRIRSLPDNPRKFEVLVQWLVTNFDNGVRYSEQEVNAIIRRYHEDYATLRRAMIDAGLMERDRGVYWRTA